MKMHSAAITVMVVLATISILPPVSSGDIKKDLELAEKTLKFVQKAGPCPGFAEKLAALKTNAESGKISSEEVRTLRRQIILSHPLLDFKKLMINKRPPPKSLYSHQCDQYYGRHSKAGPGIVILDNWKDKPRETVLLKDKLPTGSVLHPELSYDARRVIFSFCDHTVVKKDKVHIPTHPRVARQGYDNEKIGRRRFFVYEAMIEGGGVRQLTGTKKDPMKTRDGRQTVFVEDFDPCYLPGGGFVFVSTRSQNFGRCHWGRYTPSFLLYRADADGANIQPISLAEANEWDPGILSDGRVIYTRWDYVNRHNTWFQSLWVTNPDGTATAHFYGNYSKNPCVIAEARAVPGSHKVVANATAHHFISAGSIILIDPHKGQDGMEPLERITPEVKFPETEGWGLKGCYATPWPLSEDLFLVAYSPEIVNWETKNSQYNGTWPSKKAFGIYLIDTLGGRELIYRDPEISCFAPTPIRPTPEPHIVLSRLAKKDTPRTGTCFLRDVYQSTQPIAKGSIKYLRINRIYNQPTASVTRRSPAVEELVKSVIGTVPVNDDGSAAFRVSSGVGFQLQALDENKMAIMTMRSLMYLLPGETISCVGCHEQRTATPYPSGATPKNLKIHDPVPPAGPRYEGGFSFMRTVQPVLDRFCISCHGLEPKPKGNMVLLSGSSYQSLTKRKGMVRIAMSNGETYSSKPKDYFAHAGKLAGILVKRREKYGMSREDLSRIITWLDLNAQQYGDYSFNRIENRKPDPAGEKALRAYVSERFGNKEAARPYAALVNVGQVDESRILMAPLSTTAGGWGQFAEKGWKDKKDPSYQKMAKLVEASIAPMKYKDINGTCGRDKCICGCCWVRKLRESGK